MSGLLILSPTITAMATRVKTNATIMNRRSSRCCCHVGTSALGCVTGAGFAVAPRRRSDQFSLRIDTSPLNTQRALSATEGISELPASLRATNTDQPGAGVDRVALGPYPASRSTTKPASRNARSTAAGSYNRQT